MKSTLIGDTVEITSDGSVVWVNTLAGTIARFGNKGIDVHTADTSGCLYCVPGTTTLADWEVFKEKVFVHHYIVVSDEHMPDRFRSAK